MKTYRQLIKTIAKRNHTTPNIVRHEIDRALCYATIPQFHRPHPTMEEVIFYCTKQMQVPVEPQNK